MSGITGQRETRSLRASVVEVRADAGQPPRITGYASLFNEPYDVGGFFAYRETVAPGAFRRALAEKQDVRLLVNHDGLPLARTASGTLTLSEDKRGLSIDAELDATDPDVLRLLPKMQRGDLSQMSIAFQTVQEKWTFGKGAELDSRTLLDCDLFDVSVVTYPASPNTSAQIRALGFGIGTDFDAVLRVCARARNGAELVDADHDVIRRALDELRGFLPAEPVAIRFVDTLRRQLELSAVS